MATTVQIFIETGSEQAVVEVIDEAVGLGVQAGRRAIGSTEADLGKVDVSDDELLAVARVAARVAERCVVRPDNLFSQGRSLRSTLKLLASRTRRSTT